MLDLLFILFFATIIVAVITMIAIPIITMFYEKY